MDKNVIMAIVLGALVVVAALQAFQLFGLKNQLSSGAVQTTTVSTPTQTGGSSGNTVPSNIQNLPSMVGGC